MSEKTEIWRPIPGYEGRYSISSVGDVRSLRTNTNRDGLLAVHVKFGYPKVLLAKDGKVKWHFIHRLVWAAFMGPIPKGLVVNHIDHNKANPRLENLEVVTQAENVRQAIARLGHSSTTEKYKQTIARRRLQRKAASL